MYTDLFFLFIPQIFWKKYKLMGERQSIQFMPFDNS